MSLVAAGAASGSVPAGRVAPDLPTPPRSQLERAAAMLEGVFLRQLLKVMRETVPESPLFGENLGQSVYTQMFDEAVAEEVSRGEGMGLRPILLAQLGGAGIRPPASARRAAAALRSVAALDAPPREPAASSAPAALLGGVSFSAPERPEPVRLRDPDGKLTTPLAGTALDGDRLNAPRGAEVRAAGSGEVVASGQGWLVIDHGRNLRTHYQGLGRVQTQVGDLVLRGQAVGTAGAEGLRFQVTRGGRPVAGAALGELLQGSPALP